MIKINGFFDYIFILFLTSVVLIVSTVDSNQNSVYNRKSVNTAFGIIKGETISPGVEDLPAVTQFLGIPYGLAPNGQYRFNMAISAAKWTHQPKDALKNPPVCMQSGFVHLSETEALKVTSAQHFDFTHRILPFLSPQSEDCLFMNIYVPERLEQNVANSPMPVLVLIHGSEYGWGSGNAINGSILASSGQMVVVTVNYRLDVYGFLGRCEASCSGNAGISDLVAALKMLSNILPAFNADPQLITLLGDRSGASIVSLLMASPITLPKTRLFKRAILLDGTALSPGAMTDHPQQYFMRIAQELQCFDTKKLKEIKTEQILQCLQFHSQQNLTSASRKIKPPSFLPSFAPIVDGQIVPNSPKFSFSPKFGSLFRDIDLMVGVVSHPAHHLLPNLDLTEGITIEKRDRVLRTLTRNLFDYHRTEIFEAIVNEYTDWENPKNNSKSLRNSLLNTLNDVLYNAPLIETVRSHSTDEALKVSNTYFYVFGHETKSWASDQSENGIHGALSDDQIFYIFGYPLIPSNNENMFANFKNDDRGISKVMMRYVSNFVKTGDPTKPQPMSTQSTIEDRFHGVPWPEFNQATREAYLEITDKPRIKNYYRSKYSAFWNSYIPKLNKGTKDRQVDEEHHFLPNHFNRQTFYGVVRPYSSFHNDPFPPPPISPPPVPKDLKRPSTTQQPASTEKPPITDPPVDKNQTADTVYHALVAVLALGITLLVINVCCYIAFFRKYMDVKRGAKKPVNYQSYMSHAPTNEVNYIPNAPLNQQLIPNNTALTRSINDISGLSSMPPSRHVSRDETSRTSSFAYEPPFNTIRHHHHIQKYHQISGFTTSPSGTTTSQSALITSLTNGHSFNSQEQEPLLASKSSTPALIRTGISPTCPRHGQAAQLIASRANSIGSTLPPNLHNNNNLITNNNNFNSNSTTLEEVQV